MTRLPRRAVQYAAPLALAVAALLAPTAPASAAAPATDLNCTITVTTDLHPPLTPQLRHIAFTSHGLTGTADCTGTADGQPVTGPGMFGITDVALANCTQASGSGTFVLRVPTASGTKTVAGRTTFTSAAGVTTQTGDLTGTAIVISAVGDCVTTPLTQATALITGHVT